MKLSNALVSVITMFALGVAVGSYFKSPETVIVNVPVAAPNDGSGYEVIYPEHPTHRQSELLGLAYDIAKRDGHKYPQLLQGIILQETKAGTLPRYKVIGQEFGLKPNERYYGVSQLKLAAAWEVLHRYPELWEKFTFNTHTDEEIISKLINDDHFNLAVASKYLLILRSRGYETMQELAVAYNKGAGGARKTNPKTDPYSLGVMAHIQQVALHKNGS